MAHLICTLEEFHNIVGPKVRNDVATVTKQKKHLRELVCEHCGTKAAELDAAHKHDSSRRDIIKSILDDYKSEDGKYVIPNLQKILDKIKEMHKSHDVFFFLCKECHRKYDNSNKMYIAKENSSNRNIGNSNDLRQIILALFKENPTKFYTPKMMYEIIQQRDTKYYADTLWGLWKHGFLIHPQRGYYQWNAKK
jgi:protein-arginine kinase activator protein McsA